MIISHKHKYLFIQLDQTASTAMAGELVKKYDGKPILWKHARYCDFIRKARAEKKYFKFSGVRNPLDVVVSVYLRRKFDHGGRFSKGKAGFDHTTKLDIDMYNFIKKTNADFPSFFKKFYSKKIYNEWKTKDFDKLDYIYHFEDVQNEFSAILDKLGIKQERPLPVANASIKEGKHFESYYTQEIQALAKIVFGKYMKKWGYEFPKGWKNPSLWDELLIMPYLDIKYLLYKIAHMIIDHPSVHSRIYPVK
jgi:hypothetical protein